MFGLPALPWFATRRPREPVAPEYIVLLHKEYGLGYINEARQHGIIHKGYGYTYSYTTLHREGDADVFMVNVVPGPVTPKEEVELTNVD